MFTNMALRTALKSASVGLRGSCALSRLTVTCSALSSKNVASSSAFIARPANINGAGSSAVQSVRHYARAAKTKKPAIESQLSDLPSTMLKMDYAAVPIAHTSDDIVKRLLTLELASHKEKLQLKKEQLVAKVRRDEADRSSIEFKVAILTARIRNYQEHLHKHHKDKANKRRMLMSIDRRKKLLKTLRLTRYDDFENVCQQLGITYTFPPEYYRRITRRWLAKKAFCMKVFKEVQKQKAEERLKMKQAKAGTQTKAAVTQTEAAKTQIEAAETQTEAAKMQTEAAKATPEETQQK